MTTLERIDQDFKEAMKAKNDPVLSTLRMMRSAIKNKQIDVQHELTEPEVIAVLKIMLKQYQDALQDFVSAGRQDLVEKSRQEIDLLNRYLPVSMGTEELTALVEEAVRTSGSTDVGRAMGAAMKAVAGRADGAEVRVIVERLFSEKKS